MPASQGTLEVAPQPSDSIANEIVVAMPPRIQVHDAGFNMVRKGFGSLQEKLNPGLYLVRVENGATPFEKVIYVPPGGRAEVSYPVENQPQTFSAGVVYGSSSLHEYTGGFTRHLSQTVAAKKHGTGARLVVLASRPDETQRAPIKFRSVRLLNASGNLLDDLAQSSLTEGPNTGDLATAYAAEVDAGGLVLEWKDESTKAASCWRQSLWLPAGYAMVIFLTVPPGRSTPVMSSASIHLAHLEEGFEPSASSASAAECALDSLRTRRQLLSKSRLQNDLLGGKFQNPMLGIYGAHMILQRTMPDSEKAEILKEVLGNLENLVPKSPDVAALRLMANRLLGSSSAVPLCDWPPMIRLGYVAYREADYAQPGAFIGDKSVADRIRTALASGGVWTRWNAERNSVVEFPNASNATLQKVISKRLAQSVKAAGLQIEPEQVKGFSSAIADAGFLLGKHVLSALAPTLLGSAAGEESVDVQQSMERILSSSTGESTSTSEEMAASEQSALADFSWTGLNKNQIKDVARSVLRWPWQSVKPDNHSELTLLREDAP
jgi:hypothetical protein